MNLAKEKYLKGRRARDIEIIVDNMKHYPESEGQWLYDLMNDLMPKSSSQRKGTASGDRSGQLPLSLCFFGGVSQLEATGAGTLPPKYGRDEAPR